MSQKLNKIYICSTNLSGKAYLQQLLDSHPQIFCFPFHKFGFSHLSDTFFNILKSDKYPVVKGYFNVNKKYVLSIINQNDNKVYEISFGELLTFIFNEMDSIPTVLQIHFTKVAVGYCGDNNKFTASFDFNLYLFVDTFFDKLKNLQSHPLTIEQLDDHLYSSFVKSVSNYNFHNNPVISKSLLYGSNGSDQIHNLYKYYKNFKILFMKRDPISISYSNSKRILSKRYPDPDSDKIYDLMVNSSVNINKNINKVVKTANEYLVENDNIKIISFEDLIRNTEIIMKEISLFLDIEFNNCLLSPTLMGDSLGINDIVDDPYKIYSSTQLRRLSILYNGNVKFDSFKDKILYLFDSINLIIKKFRPIFYLINIIKKSYIPLKKVEAK